MKSLHCLYSSRDTTIKHTLYYFLAALASVLALILPGHAETDRLRNPKWQEIPGTRQSGAAFDATTYIDINNIARNGDVLILDTSGGEPDYARIEVNCLTNKSRALRLGYFVSKTKVEYADQNYRQPWGSPLNSYQQAINRFACALGRNLLDNTNRPSPK
jgi:hypothetical protein